VPCTWVPFFNSIVTVSWLSFIKNLQSTNTDWKYNSNRQVTSKTAQFSRLTHASIWAQPQADSVHLWMWVALAHLMVATMVPSIYGKVAARCSGGLCRGWESEWWPQWPCMPVGSLMLSYLSKNDSNNLIMNLIISHMKPIICWHYISCLNKVYTAELWSQGFI